MNLASMILRAVSELTETEEPAERWICPSDRAVPAALNHCVVFLKPETLAMCNGVRVAAILDLVLSSFQAHSVETGAIRVVNGPWLGHYGIMEEHYGVINRVSRMGEAALSPPTRRKLDAECRGVPHRILGAHQFLREFPDVSAFALNIIATTIGTRKVASGKYFSLIEVPGERIVVLNPFHPAQLLYFTRPGRTIALFECWTDTCWNVLRQRMTGATDPSCAALGSIRRVLLDRKSEFGLREVTTAANGIHCSAGPLEAMVEYCRFFSDYAKNAVLRAVETPFGRVLLGQRLSEKGVARLMKNPLLGKGADATYAFNLTEEMDSDAAAVLLAGALGHDLSRTANPEARS